MYRSHVEPNCANFFKSIEKQGGPIFPDICFEQIYQELYIQNEEINSEDEDMASNSGDPSIDFKYEDDPELFDGNGNPQKKRGRKPKTYHIQKMLDVARQKEQAQIDNEIKKGSDEEDIEDLGLGSRANEFK